LRRFFLTCWVKGFRQSCRDNVNSKGVITLKRDTHKKKKRGSVLRPREGKKYKGWAVEGNPRTKNCAVGEESEPHPEGNRGIKKKTRPMTNSKVKRRDTVKGKKPEPINGGGAMNKEETSEVGAEKGSFKIFSGCQRGRRNFRSISKKHLRERPSEFGGT